MDFRWAGSHKNKIDHLQTLLNEELKGEPFKQAAIDDFCSVHICQSCPQPNTQFWYVENQRSNSLQENISYYLDLKQKNNISHVLIKTLSYSPLNGYIHAYINENDNVTLFKHESEIDLQLIEKLAEFKLYANN